MTVARILTLSLFLFSLSACSYFWEKDVDNSKQYELSSSPGHHWLQANKDDIVQQLISVITERHPVTADWFPRLQLSNVSVAADQRLSPDLGLVEPELADILTRVSAALLPPNVTAPQWQVQAKVRFMRERQLPSSDGISITDGAALAGYGLFCWYSFLLICPSGGEASVVEVDWTVSTDREEIFTLRSLGATNFIASTPWLADNPAFLDPGIAKALSAAIAGFADTLVQRLLAKRQQDQHTTAQD